MSVSINIPEELYDQARGIAESHRVSVEQVFASALADQFAAWQRLRERAARGDRENSWLFSTRSRTLSPRNMIGLKAEAKHHFK